MANQDLPPLSLDNPVVQMLAELITNHPETAASCDGAMIGLSRSDLIWLLRVMMKQVETEMVGEVRRMVGSGHLQSHISAVLCGKLEQLEMLLALGLRQNQQAVIPELLRRLEDKANHQSSAPALNTP
jgi:hypothetical protein